MRQKSVRPSPRTSDATSSSIHLVDEALRVAARREFFTRVEALRLLHRVELGTRGHAGANVEEIVVGVDVDTAGQAMLSRIELVDSLLDIRLALS